MEFELVLFTSNIIHVFARFVAFYILSYVLYIRKLSCSTQTMTVEYFLQKCGHLPSTFRNSREPEGLSHYRRKSHPNHNNSGSGRRSDHNSGKVGIEV